MRMLKKILLIILLILFIPLTVNAGIICSDGWESSCVVPGPGCCSHHGGIGYSNTYSDYSSADDSFIDRLNNGEYAGILTLLIIFGPIVFGLIGSLKQKIKESFGTNVNDSNDEDNYEEEYIDECDEELIINQEETINEQKKYDVNIEKSIEGTSNSKSIWIVILIILLIIGLSIYLSKDEKMTVEKFARYISDDVALKYIENKGEVKDEKIHISEFYYNSSYYVNFKEYYEEVAEEVKDDYIIIVNYDEENYRVLYYEEEDKHEEFVDYIKYYASQYYAEDIANEDWSSKKVKISTLKELGYIKSKYYKDLYKELKNEILNDEIVIYSEITYEEIFKVEYIEN